MTMKLSTAFTEARQAFINAVTNGESKEKQGELYNAMLESLFEEAKKQARQEVEALVATNPADSKLSLREREFFNDMDKTAPTGIEKLFPQETVDRIFEDLVRSRPLLEHIGLRNAGIRLKFLKSSTSGQAVWGKINDEIRGQLRASFDDEEAIQNKLTAFVVLPKDTEKFGPGWVQSFVSLQIKEAFATALEAGFLNGDGDNKPIGLSRSLTGTVAGDKTTYAEKTAQTMKLTFEDSKTVVKELTEVYKYHSTKADNETPVAVEGNLVMVVNPADVWDVKKQYTSQNAQGAYITAMPYNLILAESVAQTAGKVTTFVKGRYDALIAGGIEFGRFTETFALEDLNLYTAKQFAYGKAHDEKAAAVWTLKLPAK
ncbi:phage major capsid protein [Streptococcus acidominimus]|uniref:Phage major capsid protein n=2 Tax=Bacteria TaxID=2 RepID=A0A4Y9FPP8_STRAI|nr:phage major capsid protein [Streptococcus acidominimus]MBF0819122.1 phage major capsid protein [Streptococcus acidominimus]MBF0838666.1 phage major capsid protein [Streptococcus acidominimus]MBF0846841.1 phage major capsid protein [Streptococcus danieliae]TFU30279.1 phage major capsid protein [Streptococcus acidominimus]